MLKEPRIAVVTRQESKDYGSHQKRGYSKALAAGANIVVTLDTSFEQDKSVIAQLAQPIVDGDADLVIGLPASQTFASRFLTVMEAMTLNRKFSDLHSGFRAYSRRLLCDIPYGLNSDGAEFDAQVIAQANYQGYVMAEIPLPMQGLRRATSEIFLPTLRVMGQLLLQKFGWKRYAWLEARKELGRVKK